MKTQPINLRSFSRSVNISCPTSWDKLTDKQLVYYAFLAAHFSSELAKAFFLLRLSNLKVKERLGHRFLCIYKGKEVFVEPIELAIGIEQLKFLDTQFAVRPSKLKGYFAVNNLLQGDFTFFEFLKTDNFFQLYLQTENEKFIVKMANFLYRTDKGEYANIKRLSDTQVAVVVLWFMGVKNELQHYFPHYFKPHPTATDKGGFVVSNASLMEINDAQIRALTGGDVTKENEVLNLPCWRCFAELNAKARESEELKKLYKK